MIDFLLLGAPKCGTSALAAALGEHPALFMSVPKEPKFFLTDGPPPSMGGGPGDVPTWGEHVWRPDDFAALFRDAEPGALRGEATTFYLYDRDAQRRIHEANPAAKVIAVLRDPVERAHSNWMHLRNADLEPEPDFLEALEAEEKRLANGWAHFWHYSALSRYGGQLHDLYSCFDRDQVLVLRYRDLREEPVATVDRVCRFLGVPDGVVRAVPRRNVRPDVVGRTQGPTRRERAIAVNRFVDDVRRTEELTGWDLAAWRT